MSNTINAKQLKKMLDNNEAVLVDIRSLDEHNREKIANAQCIEPEALSNANLDKSKTIVFHCKSGMRTMAAKAHFEKLGVEYKILEGGLDQWKKDGFQTQINAKAPFPLMRQVQITVGFFVLLGCILAIFVAPGFIAIPLFFGAGLLFAGLSGFCGLARFLMVMPWNRQ